MSAQTGTGPTSGPVSQRAFDRARYRVDRLRNEPNPVWIRELKQSARLARTPILLMVMTILLTIAVAAIGGLVSTEYSPATTGIVLFQVFFSFAWFVVTLVGPAVAANSIAAEREGHTWEAVVLTGLPPARIARGKFLAAFTSIGAYIVAVAPVGALSFLFGGVTATEVVVAFAFLFLVALLSVAFGLAVSSMMDRARGAILATVLLSFPISLLGFLMFGVGFSFLAHSLWPGVPDGSPIWLPMAYERANFDLLYVVCLVALPIVAVTLPAWFLYEVTISNLTSVTDDRSTRLKIWFLVATPALAIAASVAPFLANGADRMKFTLVGASLLAVFLTFSVLLFEGDPIGPSRRVLAQWDAAGTSKARRLLGPGVIRSADLLLLAGVGALIVVLGSGAGAVYAAGRTHLDELEPLGLFSVYAIGFGVFVVGLGAYLRSRISTAIVARIATTAILFGISVGPWIVAAIAGVIATSKAYAIGAPSPFYAFYLVEAVGKHDAALTIGAGVACAGVWGVLGLVFAGLARRACGKIIRKHEELLAETDRILAAEDDAAAAAEAANAPEAAFE